MYLQGQIEKVRRDLEATQRKADDITRGLIGAQIELEKAREKIRSDPNSPLM